MESRSEYLLVTLANRDFLNQARQLFSSVYWNAGWQGDYLLLAHDVPEKELEWFRNKGILVYDCPPLVTGKVGSKGYFNAVLSKCYLFTPYFRQWKKIIFLDADVIVRASLDRLTLTTGFAASKVIDLDLRDEFERNPRHLFVELCQEYTLRGPAFNSGVMAFDTQIITDGLFAHLVALYNKFGVLNRYGEEATLNLAFCGSWTKLSMVYNLQVEYMASRYYVISSKKTRAIILHFVGKFKPWLAASPYEAEWRHNLEQAETIDLTHRPPAKKVWSNWEINAYPVLLLWKGFLSPLALIRRAVHRFDWCVGQIGLLIKKISPDFYETIRFKKDVS